MERRKSRGLSSSPHTDDEQKKNVQDLEWHPFKVWKTKVMRSALSDESKGEPDTEIADMDQASSF
ncbi:MAG: hypothetical protein AAF438_04300 [Pseudomonadota bacterium]